MVRTTALQALVDRGHPALTVSTFGPKGGLTLYGSGSFFVLKLIRWVKRGHGDDEEFELADGAVAAAGADHDGGEGLERDDVAIEFEVAFTFQDRVDLGHLFVVMHSAVLGDLREMNGGQGIPGHVGKGTPGLTAGAGHGWDISEVGDGVILFFHGFKSGRRVWRQLGFP